MPQGSILALLLFSICVNDMKQAMSSDLLLYADNSCLVFQHKYVKEIDTNLNNGLVTYANVFLIIK